MCQTVVELQEQTEEVFSERESRQTSSGDQRALSPSRGDKEKYLLALNEAIMMGRRSAHNHPSETKTATDRRCVQVMLVKLEEYKHTLRPDRPVMCHQEHHDDDDEEEQKSVHDRRDQQSVVCPQEVEEVKQEVHRCESTVPLVCVCVCLTAALMMTSESSLRSVMQ